MSRYSVRATAEESAQPLIGDALIGNPLEVRTHAITIRCAPGEGVAMAGANGGAAAAAGTATTRLTTAANPARERIDPSLQQVEVGDMFPFLPGSSDGFTVLASAPGRSLLLAALGSNGAPVVTWAFVLEPIRGGSTRLLVRVRASKTYQFHGLPPWLLKRIVPPGHS